MPIRQSWSSSVTCSGLAEPGRIVPTSEREPTSSTTWNMSLALSWLTASSVPPSLHWWETILIIRDTFLSPVPLWHLLLFFHLILVITLPGLWCVKCIRQNVVFKDIYSQPGVLNSKAQSKFIFILMLPSLIFIQQAYLPQNILFSAVRPIPLQNERNGFVKSF